MCFAQSAALHLRGCSCSEPAAAVATDAVGRMMGMMGVMGMSGMLAMMAMMGMMGMMAMMGMMEMMAMMGMMAMMAMMGDPATIGDPGEAKIDANWHQILLYFVGGLD